MNKCDCCGKFGDLEEVTITIKKHNECDVNTLFGVDEIEKVNLDTLPNIPFPPIKLGNQYNSIPKVIDHDMPPIDLNAQAMAEKLKLEGKL